MDPSWSDAVNADWRSPRDVDSDTDWGFTTTGPLRSNFDSVHPLPSTRRRSPPERRPVERTSSFDTSPPQPWYDRVTPMPRPRGRVQRPASLVQHNESGHRAWTPPITQDPSNMPGNTPSIYIATLNEDPLTTRHYRFDSGDRRPTRSQNPSPFEVKRHFLSGTTSTTSDFSVDLRELEYVQPFDRNLLCPICQCPFVTPVKLNCDHIFCMECIGTALEHQQEHLRNCPSCRTRAHIVDIETVPKLIQNMLDDMKVRCPLASKGCSTELTRSAIENHITKYCSQREIDCPAPECARKVQRKWAADGQCHHSLVLCGDCQDYFMESSLSEHQATSCAAQRASCPDCHLEVLQAELSAHRASCPEALVACSAATHGCTFSSKADQLIAHEATCPIRMMAPSLEAQTARLDGHEAALKQLQRQNSIYRVSIANMQEILGLDESSDANTPAGRSSSGTHLLALHETLRGEVNRVSNAIEALDAKTSMMILNEAIRHKDDMAQTNGALSNVRMQLQWLISSRSPVQTVGRGRMAVHRPQAPSEAGPSVPREASDTGSGLSRGPGGLGQSVSSLSDSARQEPKL